MAEVGGGWVVFYLPQLLPVFGSDSTQNNLRHTCERLMKLDKFFLLTFIVWVEEVGLSYTSTVKPPPTSSHF